ncbi:MAG: hypothetical protein GY758_09785 [Fuerstiella sp.]|nr:hypothetical protein [Fuerstiella sp.]
MPSSACLRRPLFFFVALTLLCPATTFARDEDDGLAPLFALGSKPMVVVTGASASRLREEATYMFNTAGLPDAVDAIMAQLDENVNGLKGLDWERPAGIMMYLDSVFPPAFEFVAFLPVTTPEEFRSMMELGSVIMRQEPGEEGRYELITARRNLQIRIEGDYAFIQLPMMDPDPAFERELPDPGALVSALTSQFDVAISLDVEAVPKGTRDLILNMLTSTMSTQMQQRDEEPESTYQIRKSWMEADIDGMKLFFDECRRISFGLNVVADERAAHLDMLFDVREGTKMLEEIFASATKPSYFTPIISDTSPVSLSWSAVMAERDIERYEGVLEGLKGELARVIEENDLGSIPDDGSPLFHAIAALQETVSEGHLDAFGQFYRDSSEKLVVAGALRVQDGQAISVGLLDLLMRVQNQDDIGAVETGYREHAGVNFHRLEFKNPDAGALELFGSNPGITFGVGERSIWVCIGGDDSFETLTGVMDDLVEAYENPTDHQVPASFRLVARVNELIGLVQGADSANKSEKTEDVLADQKTTADSGGKDTPSSQRGGGRNAERAKRMEQFRQRREQSNLLFREALAEGDDEIRLEGRPTENGMRLRVRVDEGFIRGLGRVLATRFGLE